MHVPRVSMEYSRASQERGLYYAWVSGYMQTLGALCSANVCSSAAQVFM